MVVPKVHFCVNSVCNFKCFYCQPGGESGCASSFLMKTNEIKKIMELLVSSNINSVKFTGGEPLLRKDIVQILGMPKNLGFREAGITTNGFYLRRLAKKIAKEEIDFVTVSLDSLKKTKFKQITGVDGLERVLEGIKECRKEGLPLRINTVLTKENFCELDNIINFCAESKAELKLLDLLEFRVKKEDWEKKYLRFGEVKQRLEKEAKKKELFSKPEDFGTPMIKYYLDNGAQVIIKDSEAGTHYGDICNHCSFFPCQDGLFRLRITHDGMIKKCWPRNDINVSILGNIKKGKKKSAKEKINTSLKTFIKSKFYREKWKKFIKFKKEQGKQ